MHLQVRGALTKQSTSEGTGAMAADPDAGGGQIDTRAGALLDVLTKIKDAEINLRLIGGAGVELTGELVLGVDDEDLDALIRVLREANVRNVHKVPVRLCEIEDKPGALADCLAGIAEGGGLVHEVFVGTARDGLVPVQVTFLNQAMDWVEAD